MRVLIVDDEKLALEDIHFCVSRALKKINRQDAEIIATQSWKEALKAVDNGKIDIAFLDIQMPGKNGLDLGRELNEISPCINLIYVSAFNQYAVEANSLHISGYLMKPVDEDQIVEELRHLRYEVKAETKDTLKIRCFGNFDVFYQDKPIHFRRQKAKELFAYLIDKNGSSATADEICASLFDKTGSEASHKNTLRVLSMELKQILTEYGLKDAYTHTRNSYSIRPEMLDCDYFRYLNGEKELYQGKYMEQYTNWAYI